MKSLFFVHSSLRWAILLTLIMAIIIAFRKRKVDQVNKKDKLIYLLSLIIIHSQLLIGIVMYYFSSKVTFNDDTMGHSLFRFFTIEHTLGMLIAIILVTIGYKKGKKDKGHKKIFIYYLSATIIILISIPWPFREGLGVSSWI